MIEINVNCNVQVRLTDFGRAVHRKDYEDFWRRAGLPAKFEYSPPVEDADGWSRWQLWSLMQNFGNHITLGGPVPFETTIRLEEA